jgi:phosphatidylglycerophosphate synthase
MVSAQPESRQLLRSALTCILPLVVLSVPAAMLTASAFAFSGWYIAKMLAVLGIGVVLVLRGLLAYHPFRSWGPANFATSARGVLVALLVAMPGEQTDDFSQLVALLIGIVAASLDSLDGWLARKARMTSAFGARFDMETDALLILALSLLAWQFGKAGPWVLLSGLLRYSFVVAGFAFPWLRAPLPPSFRRKTVAVVQIVALLFTIAPFVSPAVSAPIAALALLALVISFLVDVSWLRREAS